MNFIKNLENILSCAPLKNAQQISLCRASLRRRTTKYIICRAPGSQRTAKPAHRPRPRWTHPQPLASISAVRGTRWRGAIHSPYINPQNPNTTPLPHKPAPVTPPTHYSLSFSSLLSTLPPPLDPAVGGRRHALPL
jgi:hypothetical protein